MRHQEKVHFRIGAAGVVAHTEIWLVNDHPVCGAKVGFAELFLMPQPPLLTRPHEEGITSTRLLHNSATIMRPLAELCKAD
jgi:hypothetical protein